MRHGDDFDWLGGHSANLEAPEVNLRGSSLGHFANLEAPEVKLQGSWLGDDG